MEPFLDGGLFELLFALAFAILVNYIYLKKYLLILYSLMIICAPISLFFIHGSELYYWIEALSLFNSILLVILMWKQKKEKPREPLFNIEEIKRRFSEFKNKISSLFSKNSKPDKTKIKV